MKKTTLTEKKAENTPNGGVLVGKRKGQTIIHDEGTLSGYLVGKTHAEGGIKAVNKSTGQPLEMQGGEVVITAPAVSDQTKNQFNGQMLTNRQILSKINEKGGGVSFADGGDIPKSIKHSGEKYNYGGKTMTDYEILQMINKGGHLSKGKSLAQIAKMHNVTVKELQSQVNMGMKAESEHTSSKREQMKIVKDHLYENPKYYTLLKKAGLKKGGSLVEESKKGDHPARDLNNYNDVLDVDADGVVGAETGLYSNGGDVDFDVDGTGGADASSGVGAFEEGGDLDFLNDVDRIFDEGGSVDVEIDSISIADGSRTYNGTMPKSQYYSFSEFLSDLKNAFLEQNKVIGYFYFYPMKDGVKVGERKLAIQFKDSKNTVLNFNPLTGKSSDFYKQIERRYSSSIRRANMNFSKWLDGKSSTKTEPKKESSETKSETRAVVDYLVQIKNEANIGDIQGLKNYIDKLFAKGESRVALEIVSSGKVIDESLFYIYFSSESDPSDKRHFNVSQDLDALKYAIFGSDSNLKYNWDDFFKAEPKEEPKQEEQPIRNFELEKKYLTQRINTLSSELDLKRPILSNDEVAFYQREINKFVSKLRKVSNDEMELKPIQARVNGVYKVKWGDYGKQYPKSDLKSINGIDSELTFEEYMTVRTPEFMSFFGNWEQAYFDNTYSGVSKIINPKTKEPMPVFHGTNVLFTEWKTYETNNAHYFAVKREMSDFFASSWESRTDKAGVDSKAIKALNPNTGKFLYRCFLDIRNPIDFSKFGVEKRPIKEFLLFLKINYNIGDYDFWTNLGNAKGFTSETKVYAWQIIRLWQNFTKYVKTFTTYDGYIFYEYIPDTPFGGLENASLSFCAFESNQIKFADAYEFNALSNDSRFDFGGTL